MDLPTLRARIRRDLHDEDSSSYRWTDNEMDRHIQRAVRELSVAIPLEAKATLTTSAGSRDISVASLSDVISVQAVEYPTGKYPPVYVRFSLWESTLTLLAAKAPVGGEDVNVYYWKVHTLDGTSSTVPSYLEDLLATGAAAYAALEWASFAANRVNVGGENVWQRYQTWGQRSLSAFMKGLANYNRRNAVRARQLYSPAVPLPSQSTDWGP